MSNETDPWVSVSFDDGSVATWFPGSEAWAIGELVEQRLGTPDARRDLFDGPPDGQQAVIVQYPDGTAATWLPGSEVDALAESIESRFGPPDSIGS